MSLLMDALRKAEEAKKQAEQGKTIEDKAPEPAVTAEAAVVEPEQSEIEPEKPHSTDLSVMLEFEEGPKPVSDASVRPSLSADLDKAIETVSLSLGASAPKRPPLSQNNNTTADSAIDKDTSDVDSFFSAEDMFSANNIAPEPISTAEIELPIETELNESGVSQSKDLKVNSERPAEYFVKPETEPLSVAPRGESKSNQSKSEEYGREDTVSNISQRTAKGRQSAKSVFAAKSINSKNKKALVYGGAGVTAVVLLAGGYFLLSLGSSSNNFSLPESNFVSENEADFVSGNSGNIERVDTDFSEAQIGQTLDASIALVNTDSVDDTAAGQTAALTSGNGQIAQASQDISMGLNITSSIESTPSQLPVAPSAVAMSEVEPVQSPAANSAVAPAEQSGPTVTSQQSQSLASVGGAGASQAAAIENTAEADTVSISFRRKDSTMEVSPQLSNAFTAYQAGNLESALALYNQVLVEEPQNIDALLGKAAISSVQGDVSQAMALYSTVLALNPAQALARSGLLSLLPTVNPADQERQLRRLVTEYPSVAPLAFALGNFYASQARWIDAQKNYFNALSLAKSDNVQGTQVSPDYAFNLAISLDRLNQPGPAITYYQEALNLASQAPANFDLEIARMRINKLSGPTTL